MATTDSNSTNKRSLKTHGMSDLGSLTLCGRRLEEVGHALPFEEFKKFLDAGTLGACWPCRLKVVRR